MEKHSDEFKEHLWNNHGYFLNCMMHNMAKFQTPSLYCAMNELSNHDHSRFLTRTNQQAGRVQVLGAKAAEEGINKAVFAEAVVMQMFWPGAPTLYYGDEAGVCGFTDPDNRRTYPWGREDHELIAFHKEIIKIHKQYSVFKTGSVLRLGADYQFLAYARFNKKDCMVVVINNRSGEISKELSVWEAGIKDGMYLERIFLSYEDGFTMKPHWYEVKGGMAQIQLSSHSALILRAVSEKGSKEDINEQA